METLSSTSRAIERSPLIPLPEQSGSTMNCTSRKNTSRKKLSRTIALTGCVSKLSTLELHQHAYFDALRDYAKLYEATQAYLAGDGSSIAHDYAATSSASREFDHGLLGDDGEAVAFVPISDDEIDNCGYLGWLRH